MLRVKCRRFRMGPCNRVASANAVMGLRFYIKGVVSRLAVDVSKTTAVWS